MATPTEKSSLFEDKKFPPILHSIYRTLNREAFVDLFTENTDEIIWRRPIKIAENIQNSAPPVLFLEQTGLASRVKQGGLANCYLTAAITAIISASSNWIFENIFSKMTDYPLNGKITLLLFHNSQWEGVEIDDNIPCDLHGNPIFARSVDYVGRCENEWCVSLLEKAYAKVYGSYANIHGGNMSEALYDLTGVPVLDYSICDESKQVAKQPIATQECDWTCLYHAYKSGDAICLGYCLSVSELDPNLKWRNGILTNHAYALIGLFVTGTKRFVRIRNARCDLEFSGVYSRDSEVWRNGTKKSELTKLLGIPGDELPPGEFWMSYEEFVTFFNRVYISRLSLVNQIWLHRGTFQSIYPDNKEFGGCSNFWSWRFNPKFQIVSPPGGTVSMTLSQNDQRGIKSQLSYDQIGITVVKLVPDCGFGIEKCVGDGLVVKTAFVNRRNVSVEFKMPLLTAQEICVAIPSTFYPNVSLNWVLSVHANCKDIHIQDHEFKFHSRNLLSGKWSGTSAGGGPKHSSFLNNPSFLVKTGDSPAKIDIFLRQIVTNQKTGIATQSLKKIGSNGKTEKMPKVVSKSATKPLVSPSKTTTSAKPKVSQNTSKIPTNQIAGIGFYLLKEFQQLLSSNIFTGVASEFVYDNTMFTNREEIHKQTQLESKQMYLLIPCTFQPQIERNFILEIYSDSEITVEKFVRSKEMEPSEVRTETKRGTKASGVSHGLMQKSHNTVKSLGIDYNSI